MIRIALNVGLALFSAVLLTCNCCGQEKLAQLITLRQQKAKFGLQVGAEAPDFVAMRPDGSRLQLSDLKGKILIIDFWGTWCPPCIAAMPMLEAISKATRDDDVMVVGVSTNDDWDTFKRWTSAPAVKTSYTLLWDAGMRGASVAARLYDVKGFPCYYVVDQTGYIVASSVGHSDLSAAILRASLRRLGVSVGDTAQAAGDEELIEAALNKEKNRAKH